MAAMNKGAGAAAVRRVARADWQELVYPDAVCVRNTFLDVPVGYPSSLAEFVQERRTASCVPAVDEYVPGRLLSGAATAYVPGQLLSNTLRLSTVSNSAEQPRSKAEEVPACQVPGGRRVLRLEEHMADGSACSRPKAGPQAPGAARAASWQKQSSPEEFRVLEGRCRRSPRADSLPVDAASECSTADTDEVVPSEECALCNSGSGLPSAGSAQHALGTCKPCAFVHQEGGCNAGKACHFCHLCDASVRKEQKKAKRHVARTARRQPRRATESE